MLGPSISIGARRIGGGERCFVIAEAGVNHNGSLDTAMDLVDVSAAAKADAVKFQTFDPDALVIIGAPKARYQAEQTGDSQSQHAMLKGLSLPKSAYAELKRRAQKKGILFISTPFEEQSAAFLNELDVPLFKIPSGEITNLPFLGHVAGFGKPMIISTGMSTLSEVDTAVRCVRQAGNRDLILLHCVSSYPAPAADINLRAMNTLCVAFGVPVGYSDHILGLEIAFAAVALGASVIEKHFTLDRSMLGPDHQASLEPDELTELVAGTRRVEDALGTGYKQPAESEADTASVARKSLVAACDIPEAAVLLESMLAIKRPGTGLPPAVKPFLVGRRARYAIAKDEVFTLEMLL